MFPNGRRTFRNAMNKSLFRIVEWCAVVEKHIGMTRCDKKYNNNNAHDIIESSSSTIVATGFLFQLSSGLIGAW